MRRQLLPLLLLTACAEPTPLYLPDPSIDSMTPGVWDVRVVVEVTGSLYGVSWFTDRCETEASMRVLEGQLSLNPITCTWREGSEELLISGSFDPVPYATGVIDGESFLLDWQGGLVEEDWFFAPLYGFEGNEDGSLTLTGFLEATPSGPSTPL